MPIATRASGKIRRNKEKAASMAASRKETEARTKCRLHVSRAPRVFILAETAQKADQLARRAEKNGRKDCLPG
jgi:hypothetical protein